MSRTDLWKAPALVPTLAVADVGAAIAWLTRVFGFRERAEARLSWPGGGRAWVELGDALVTLASAGGHGLVSPRAAGATSVALKVYVADVDAHFRNARAAGATILSEAEDGFWGGRIYRAQDLDGHHWEFSERDRELASSLWRLPPGVTIGPEE
jgi:uncharacterized glyoxalase superfamily protein PhnB